MEIISSRFGFSVIESGKELASLQLIGEKECFISFTFGEEVTDEKKVEITSLCENKKNETYRIIAKRTPMGYNLHRLYLNGRYQKVGKLIYGQLEVFGEFVDFTTEIERYVNETINENFIICPS